MSSFPVSEVIGIVNALAQGVTRLLERGASPAAVDRAIQRIIDQAHAIDADVDAAARGRPSAPPPIAPSTGSPPERAGGEP